MDDMITNTDELSKENKLMYELIFGDKNEYEIDLFEYIESIKDINPFTNKVLNNLKKSGIKIKEEFLFLSEEKNIWILKLKK